MQPEASALSYPKHKRDSFQQQEKQRSPLSMPITPKCGENQKHFCVKIENYPKKLLENYLRREKKYHQFFREDMLPPQNFSRRLDDGYIRLPLCEYQERIIFPQAAKTKDNEWSIIVNHANYIQGVRVEECLKPNEPCCMTSNFPSAMQHQCRQRYTYRQLVSVDSFGNVAKELFRLPSCCMCTIISDWLLFLKNEEYNVQISINVYFIQNYNN